MFRASLCPSSGDQRPCYCIWCTALVLLDVVGSGCGRCVVGCEHCEVLDVVGVGCEHCEVLDVVGSGCGALRCRMGARSGHVRGKQLYLYYHLYRRLRLQFLVLLMMGAVTSETCKVTLR